MIGALFDYASERIEIGDISGATDCLDLLVRAPQAASDEHRPRLWRLIQQTQPRLSKAISTDQEISLWGLFARSGGDIEAHIVEQLQSIWSKGRQGGRNIIFESKGSAQMVGAGISQARLMAAARYVVSNYKAMHVESARTALEFFEAAIIGAHEAGVEPDIIREVYATVVRLRRQLGGEFAVRKLVKALRGGSGRIAIRSMEAELAVMEATGLVKDARTTRLDELRRAWTEEGEAEVKLALAEIICRASVGRRPELSWPTLKRL